jgi:DNA-binding XRE family transcriptional regulator
LQGNDSYHAFPHWPPFYRDEGLSDRSEDHWGDDPEAPLDLGLRQIDAAEMIGCDETSVVNWEKGHHSPRVNHMAGVVNFLGFQNGDTMAHRLVNHRKALGMTQKEFAGQIGVDPTTLTRWERGEREPKGSDAVVIDTLIC